MPPRPFARLPLPFVAAFAAFAVLAIAPHASHAAPALVPPVTLIETRPVETTLGEPSIPAALDTWLALIRGSKRSIDLEHFYLSTWPNEPLEPVLGALGDAAKRGVKIRLLLDARM